jgi:hypothetical protein
VPIPYANLSDPQTLNLYEYVRNNPLSITDADGHRWWKDLWNGLANATYRPLVMMVQHPIVTGKAIGNSIAHPVATVRGIKTSVTVTVTGVVHGNGEAIGVAVGTIGMALIPGGEAGDVAEGAEDLGRVGELADDANVVRGGLSENIPNGTGVTIGPDGTLNGVSVNSANGASVGDLSKGLPNGKVSTTTVGEVRAAGGNVTPSGTTGNPNHCTMCGITPQQARQIMKTIPNPSK